MWIEIHVTMDPLYAIIVTSYAEVWIEIRMLPESRRSDAVTSYAEVWIEISRFDLIALMSNGHLLRGGVD